MSDYYAIDLMHFLSCLKVLGFPVTETHDGCLGSNISIKGFGGDIPEKNAEIYVGSAGTAARFLVAMLAFSDGEYTVNSSEQMKKRPMQPLIDSLRDAGAVVKCLEKEGHFPLHIKGAKAAGQIPCSFSVNIDKSSQFLSALLIAAGTLDKDSVINVTGSHGLAYVDLTAEMMRDFGVSAEKREDDGKIRYTLNGNESYKCTDYDIEPDMSAAAYFYAMAAILGVSVCIKGVKEKMLQGDTEFLRLLEKMGCTSSLSENGDIIITGAKDGRLKGGFTIDMSSFSDQALTLAAIAPFADAPITITGIGHIRLQECDRIKAISENLSRLGIKTDENESSITIYPGEPVGAEIETYDDHRVAMSFALTGLKTEGVKILNPLCCKKTFGEYFDVLENALTQLS
ncbi:MAG: 3-phosphoshikimate 1-carboxyvinyltransferase [Ruminococcus sp.]